MEFLNCTQEKSKSDCATESLQSSGGDTPKTKENGTVCAEGDGAMSAEGDGAMSAEGDGAMSAEGDGAMSAEGDDGAMSAEGDGAMSAEGDDGAMSAEGDDGAMSAEGDDGAMSAEGDDGAMSAENNGAMSAEGDDAMSAENNGAMSAENNGAMSAEGDGAMSAEGDGAMSAEGDGAMSAEGDDAMSAENNGAMSAENNGAMSAEGDGAMNPEGTDSVKDQRGGTVENKAHAACVRKKEAFIMKGERLKENVQGCKAGRGNKGDRGSKGKGNKGGGKKDFTFHFDDDLGRLDTFQLDLENELDDIAEEAINAEPRYKYADDENKSFDEIAATMENVDENGYVKKKIVAEGTGETPPPFARALIHYDFYKEGFEEPFDSTYLRSKPCKIRLDESEVIPGLEIAVKSMKKKESAKFIFKWEVAFGIQGCPPRIPKRCTVLAYVELVDFSSLVDKKEDLQYNDGQYRLNSFARGYKDAKATHIEGNEEFAVRNIKAAVRCYRKCIALLNDLRLENADEEKRMFCLKIKCLVNLSICYNRLNKPEQACVVARQALALDEKNPKALYQYGKANLILSNLDLAEKWLRKAYKLKPDDADIRRELAKLNERKDRAKASDNLFCKRAFRLYEDEKDGKRDNGEEIDNAETDAQKNNKQ